MKNVDTVKGKLIFFCFQGVEKGALGTNGLKDYKENFFNNPTVCPTSSTKDELGRISKAR